MLRRLEKPFFAYPQPSPTEVYVSTEEFFISPHILDHLKEVAPCLARDGTGVSGLNSHFPNGHRGSMGEVRFDSLGSRFTVAGTSWFLAFSKRRKVYPYVLKADIHRPETTGDVQHVLEVSNTGILEWIWSYRQCLVICNNQQSPRTV
jgi:hypothetical protein